MGFFRVTSLKGLYLERLIHGGTYFRNFTVFHSGMSLRFQIAGYIQQVGAESNS